MKQHGVDDNLTLLDYWRIICKARWFIAGMVLVSVLVTGVVSKRMTKLYESKATLLPVREESLGGGISFGGGKDKGSGGGASISLEALGGKSAGPTMMDTLTILLNSQRIADAVVEQLNLMQYYGTASKAAASRALRSETTIKQSAYKSLEIIVLTRSPQMAADIANAFVANLDKLNKELNITATKRNRIFIEARLAEKAKKLEQVEEELKEFQTQHHIVGATHEGGGSTGAGVDGPMAAAVQLHGQIVENEVQLAALREYALPSHPMINQLLAQNEELRRQLDKLEQDQARASFTKRKAKSSLKDKVFPLFEEAPSLALELLRLTRQVKVEEAVYGMLIGSLEAARIAEVKDLPTVQPMDVAVPAEFPSRPKTMQNLQIAAGVSLLVGVLLVIFMDYLQRLKAREAVRNPLEIELDTPALSPLPLEAQSAVAGKKTESLRDSV